MGEVCLLPQEALGMWCDAAEIGAGHVPRISGSHLRGIDVAGAHGVSKEPQSKRKVVSNQADGSVPHIPCCGSFSVPVIPGPLFQTSQSPNTPLH